jgi:thioesterase domain-containing protein
MIGGEALPAPLRRELQAVIGGDLHRIRDPGEAGDGPGTQLAAPDGETAGRTHSPAKAQIHPFLEMLRDRDVRVWAEGNRLRCSAPSGALTPELREALRQKKDDILEFLNSAGALARLPRAIVPLQSRGNRTPVFGVAGHNGDVFCYRALARHLGEDWPFFGLQPPGLDGTSEPLERVEKLAAYFAAQMRAFQRDGPCILAGYCSGGGIAFELARQLVREGVAVNYLALFGTPFPTWYRRLPQLRHGATTLVARAVRHVRALTSLSFAEGRSYLAERMRGREAARAAARQAALDPVLADQGRVGRATIAAVRRFVPEAYCGRVGLFLPGVLACRREVLLHWRSVAPSTEVCFGPGGCSGNDMLREPHAAAFATLFAQRCARNAN